MGGGGGAGVDPPYFKLYTTSVLKPDWGRVGLGGGGVPCFTLCWIRQQGEGGWGGGGGHHIDIYIVLHVITL